MKDPTTLEEFLDETGISSLVGMSGNEDILKEHPENNVIGPPSDKPADFGLDLSGLGPTIMFNARRDSEPVKSIVRSVVSKYVEKS